MKYLFDYLPLEYPRKKLPVLTEKSIQGFTEEELVQRKKSLEERHRWISFTSDDYVYSRFIGKHLQDLNPREEKGVYISFDLKDYVDWIKIDLIDSEDFRHKLESFIRSSQRESPFTTAYHELLMHWINEGLQILKNEKIILDYYLACDCNDHPNNHVVFLT